MCSPDAWAPFTLGCRGGPWGQAVLPSGVCGLWLPQAGWQDGSLGAPISGPCPPALSGAGLGLPQEWMAHAGRALSWMREHACRMQVGGGPQEPWVGDTPAPPESDPGPARGLPMGRVMCVLGLPHLPFPRGAAPWCERQEEQSRGPGGTGRGTMHIFLATVDTATLARPCSCMGMAWSRRWYVGGRRRTVDVSKPQVRNHPHRSPGLPMCGFAEGTPRLSSGGPYGCGRCGHGTE